MIISRTPFRISFFGGGTDYPDWYKEHGGAVLSTTIDKYCYISCRHLPPFFEHKHRIVYSVIENVKHNNEIVHPAVKGVFNFMDIKEGLEIHHDGDLPARSGLGSSSSFTVGLLNALAAQRGEQISKHELADKAIYVEQEVIGECVGSQDQVAAAFGGLNRISFRTNGTFDVDPLIMSLEKKEEFERSFLLFFTGQSRTASEIAKSKVSNLKIRASELKIMGEMVDEGTSILQSKNIKLDDVGVLLNDSWKLKRELSEKVSTPEIDNIYETGMRAGALGGKILGAGGGGFILFYARPENHPKIRESLKNLLNVSFCFENSGSKIVLYDPQMSAEWRQTDKNAAAMAERVALRSGVVRV